MIFPPPSMPKTCASRKMSGVRPGFAPHGGWIARKVRSQAVPVIYDSRIAAGLVSHLLAAIMGSAIAARHELPARQAGDQVFAKGIEIVDDPHRRRGLASRPFDAEGIATSR